MTLPRSKLVSVSDTPYYHVVSRCVRRAFLCGLDELSGKSFEHRKAWVVERLEVLGSVFAVDLLAYAVMSNHYHLVVKIDVERCAGWSEFEVAERWGRLFSLPLVMQRWQRDADGLSAAELGVVNTLIHSWRSRLSDLSWYMRCLNEHLARKANAEDGCTGRFWEGRFHCQALLDEKAVLTGMAYVDLNPIRAKVATTPESSDYTAIRQRIDREKRPPLLALRGETRKPRDKNLPFTFPDYLELVDWSGRAIREDKCGAIDQNLPPILSRLEIPADAWLKVMRRNSTRGRRALGAVNKLQALCERLQQRWLWGMHATTIYTKLQPT